MSSSHSMQEVQFKVPPALSGFGVDRVLVEARIGLSRRKIRRILDMGGITVNGRRVRVASHKVYAGELIVLRYSVESLSIWTNKRVVLTAADILYQWDGVIAINKPPLVASQPQRSQEAPHAGGLVADYLAVTEGVRPTVFLCHRLDKETSGVLLLARDEATATQVMGQFKAKTVSKTYYAVTHGLAPKSQWQKECYLSPIDQKTGCVQEVRAGGKFSRTRFEVVQVCQRQKISLIACYPETGRSHQIRVHLALSHLPIIGDKKYLPQRAANLGADLRALTLPHHFLHAARLTFQAPRQGAVAVTAPLPPHFADFLRLAGLHVPWEHG